MSSPIPHDPPGALPIGSPTVDCVTRWIPTRSGCFASTWARGPAGRRSRRSPRVELPQRGRADARPALRSPARPAAVRHLPGIVADDPGPAARHPARSRGVSSRPGRQARARPDRRARGPPAPAIQRDALRRSGPDRRSAWTGSSGSTWSESGRSRRRTGSSSRTSPTPSGPVSRASTGPPRRRRSSGAGPARRRSSRRGESAWPGWPPSSRRCSAPRRSSRIHPGLPLPGSSNGGSGRRPRAIPMSRLSPSTAPGRPDPASRQLHPRAISRCVPRPAIRKLRTALPRGIARTAPAGSHQAPWSEDDRRRGGSCDRP